MDTGKNRYIYLAVLLFAGAIYLGCIVSPPSLMDDSDAVLAQAARTMLVTGGGKSILTHPLAASLAFPQAGQVAHPGLSSTVSSGGLPFWPVTFREALWRWLE
ncbi:MAG TPA: hypothetical protein VFF95_01640 [Candidatus Binatus sp.]|nr:hypothetical protein [Candidatus Binatus sp.]